MLEGLERFQRCEECVVTNIVLLQWVGKTFGIIPGEVNRLGSLWNENEIAEC